MSILIKRKNKNFVDEEFTKKVPKLLIETELLKT